MNQQLTRFLKYCQFKGSCIAYQEQNPLLLDYDRVLRNIEELEKLQQEKTEALKQVMPKVKKLKWQNKPKSTHKKDGTLSVAGQNWYKALKENGIPVTSKEAKTAEKLKVFDKWEEPKPSSSDQVKAWLFDLGWEPCYYKYVREGDGSERKIPQVRKDGELTPSVLALIEDNPELEHLEGLTVVQHRLGIFKGFRDECVPQEDGIYTIAATIGGLTNTLRFRHRKPLVNLPSVDKAYGEEIRGCLKAPEGYEVYGADLSSLEDTTKRHLIQPLDPEYVEEMSVDGYDPHLSLALFAGEITKEDYDWYGRQDEETTNDPVRFKKLHATRKAYKVTNYSATYKVGAKKLARETGMSVKRAQALLDAFWAKNWAVEKVATQQLTKQFGGYTWVRNPISGFWHELRYTKDLFSTLNQSSGVYVFDSWLARVMLRHCDLKANFHDEFVSYVKTGERDLQTKAVEGAMADLNDTLNLNVEIKYEGKYGPNYASVH